MPVSAISMLFAHGEHSCPFPGLEVAGKPAKSHQLCDCLLTLALEKLDPIRPGLREMPLDQF
jgi:hypothetical protein